MNQRILHTMFLLFAVLFLPPVIPMSAGDACANGQEVQSPPATGGKALQPASPEIPYQAAGDEGKDLVLAERVFIKDIQFDGNTAVSREELSAVSAAYTQREVSFEELQELRQKLTLLYINKGYINSGLVIPDQKVRDGRIVFRVTEGRLTRTEIEGTQRLQKSYILGRLEPYAKAPLNIPELQRGLQLLQQNPRISSIHAELSPDITPGDGVLKVRVAEERPFSLLVEGSNDYSPSIGSYGANVHLSHNNISGRGDILSAVFGLTFETALVEGEVSYSVPLSAKDTLLRLNFRKDDTLVIEEPFRNLDIISRNTTFAVTVSHPFYRTAYHELVVGLTGEYRKSRTFLLQRPYSFADGAVDGEASESVLRFFQEWTSRSQEQVLALRSTFSAGIDAFGATVHDSGPDGRFLTWVGQIQWIRRLGDKGLQAFFRTDMQLTGDRLLSIEKFSIGGMDSVRGYRKNVMVRDNGIASSIEMRVPLVRTEKRDDILQLIPFFDYGRSWNIGGQNQGVENIAAAGAGLRWVIKDNIVLQVFWGAALKEVPVSHKDLQDKGIHFRLSARLL